jgi:hypothetical protein
MGGGKGGGGGSMPDAPDYEALAKQDAAAQKALAIEQTRMNRPTQINPLGRMDWTQDAKGNWTQTVTADPRLKAQMDAVIAQGGDITKQIAAQGEFTGPDQIDWNPDAMKEYGDAIYGSVMDRARVDQNRDRSQMQTQLRQQGLMPGSEAYDNAFQNMLRAQGDVATQAAQQATIASKDQYRNDYMAQLSGQDQNYRQDLQGYQMPWDLAGAAQGLSQGYRPNFDTFGTSTGYNPANMTEAAQAGYQAKMGDYNAKQQQSGKGK